MPMMDPILTRPSNHKPRNPWPTILMLGVAIISFLLVSRGFNTVAQVIVAP